MEFYADLEKCWFVNRLDRPSFNELQAKCAAILGVLPSTIGPVRDIGKLLNADLSKKISRMSVRQRHTHHYWHHFVTVVTLSLSAMPTRTVDSTHCVRCPT